MGMTIRDGNHSGDRAGPVLPRHRGNKDPGAHVAKSRTLSGVEDTERSWRRETVAAGSGWVSCGPAVSGEGLYLEYRNQGNPESNERIWKSSVDGWALYPAGLPQAAPLGTAAPNSAHDQATDALPRREWVGQKVGGPSAHPTLPISLSFQGVNCGKTELWCRGALAAAPISHQAALINAGTAQASVFSHGKWEA